MRKVKPRVHQRRFALLREKAFKRDKYTCLKCGKYTMETKGVLLAHKVVKRPWGEEKLSDLETWCYDCHNEHEKRTMIGRSKPFLVTEKRLKVQEKKETLSKRIAAQKRKQTRAENKWMFDLGISLPSPQAFRENKRPVSKSRKNRLLLSLDGPKAIKEKVMTRRVQHS